MRLSILSIVVLLFLSLIPTLCRADSASWEPEEPDYAFLSGSPYTENKRFLQLILNNFYSQFRDGVIPQRQLNNFLRFEYGFTDRLEGDLVLQYLDSWTDEGEEHLQQNGFGDTILGLRYRFLKEASFPVTLTFGPQLLLPTGKINVSIGVEGFGIGWDLTMAREWNRLIFTYLNLNYATTLNANDPTPASLHNFTLHNFFWAIALGFRPLERDGAKGDHHCIHVTLETGGTLGQSVEAGQVIGNRITQNTFLILPGIRYGYLTKHKTLTEIGLGAPVGFGQNSPTWGVVLQTQFEYGFVKKD
jgi:hypothetical protein